MERTALKQITADQFNATFPVGTPCRYFPVMGEIEHIDTKTRTPAWTLGHGRTVVSVEGKAGGVDITHLVMEG